MRRVIIATIQIALDASTVNSESGACDYISETLGNLEDVVDWQYLAVGGQRLTPQERPGMIADANEYEEGDCF